MWLYFLYNSNAVSGVSFPVNDLIGANSSLGFTSNNNILSNKVNASNINFSNLNALGFSGTSFMPSELIKSQWTQQTRV